MLQDALDKCVESPPPGKINAEEFLTLHLNNKMDNATMELQQRTHPLKKVTEALNCVEDSASQKTNIAFSFSPRGSGKTQFIKWSLGKLRLGALTCGRVIVRCCDRAKKAEQPWLTKVMGQETRKGLCELIREHVATVTGRSQAPADYSTPDKAYETWMRVTAQYFRIPDGAKDIDPLIVLDTLSLRFSLEFMILPQCTDPTANRTRCSSRSASEYRCPTALL